MSDYRYKAFLSYSHEDRRWARWLHRALEGYRVPSRLVGQRGLHGEIPRRLNPVFRDREDLTAHADLGSRITTALETSQFLIVICSPAAAKSKWVNEEVIKFKKVHGEGRLLSVIVDGEPFASDRGVPEDECFPPAMRFRVDADGRTTDRPIEPLAADIRRTGDGRRRARLKMIAGMVGVELDELAQRENQRRHRRQSIVSAASGAGMIVMGALTWFAFVARDEAQTRQAQAEGLIEFMISDLRGKLEPVGRLDLLDVVGRRALAYYAEQRLDTLASDALGRRSRSLLLIGEIDMARGNLDEALKAFQEAGQVTDELLARYPMDGQRVFDHAQSVFWLGYIDWQRGALDSAEKAFETYLELARRMVLIDPDNVDWQTELGYAYSNLGIMFFEQGRVFEAVGFFEQSLGVAQEILNSTPEDAGRRYNVAQSLAWLADSESHLSNYDRAVSYRQEEIALYQQTLAVDSQDRGIHSALTVARRKVGGLLLIRGDLTGAEQELRAAVEFADDLVSSQPDNMDWANLSVQSYSEYASVLMHLGRLEEARSRAEKGVAIARRLVASDAGVPSWQAYYTASQIALVRVMARQGMVQEALALAQLHLGEIDRGTKVGRESQDGRWQKAYLKAVIAQFLSKVDQLEQSVGSWNEVIGEINQYREEMAGKGDALLMTAYLQIGKSEEAQKCMQIVKRSGYNHPDHTQTLWGDKPIQ